MNINAELLRALDDVFRSSFDFYYEAHAAHWNVKGINFLQFHQLFEAIYTDTYGALDDLAEAMRRLDGFPPQQIGPLGQSGNIESDPNKLCHSLIRTNGLLLEKVTTGLDVAGRVNEQGVLNLLAERQFAHEKFRWMLTATVSN